VTIAFRSAGAVTSVTGSATSLAPGLPGSLVNGDLVLLFVMTKPDTATVTTPTDWTLVADVAGGGGTNGNGTGPTRQTVFMREKTAGWSAMPTVAVTSGNSSAAQAFAYSKTAAAWIVAAATGSYSGNGTAWSATMGSDPGIAAGDWVVCGSSNQDEGPTWSAQAITATGISAWGTATERSEVIEATTGLDMGGMVFDRPVTTGTSSAAPVVTATTSAASRGTQTVIRLRDGAPPAQTMSPTGIASGEAFPGAGGGTPAVAGVTETEGNTTAITATLPANTAAGDLLLASMMIDANTSASTGTPSGWTASSLNVIEGTGGTPDERMYVYWKIAGAGETNPTFNIDVARDWAVVLVRITGADATTPVEAEAKITNTAEAAGLSLPLPTTTTLTDNALLVGLTNADASAGLTPAMTWPSPWTEDFEDAQTVSAMGYAVGSYTQATAGASTGGNLTLSQSDRAARAVFAIKPGGGGGGGHTVSYPAGAAQTMTATAIASAEAIGTHTAQVMAPGSQTLVPTGIATAEAWPSGGGQSNPNLPVQMSTNSVEPESHSYNVTVMDSNGNLYRILESKLEGTDADDMNQPKMMKSSDGGETWVQQDSLNRPGREGTFPGSVGDLESAWLTYSPVDKAATFTWQRSYPAYSRFFTSDHPTTPDTWEDDDREQVATASGSPQFMSHTSPQDQSYEWLFFTDGSGSSYVSRPKGANTTSSGKSTIDAAGMSPAAMLDSNNVSHILFKKSSQLHYKKLTSGGTLDGSSTRVDANGVHTEPIPHAAPQPWVNGGNTYVGCLFTNSSAHLKFVLMTNGTPGSEETITTSAVLHNPGATGGQGAVITLAVDPVNGTMHALWIDSTSGDVMYATRPHGSTWSTPSALQNPAFTPAWVYAKVNTYPSTLRVLSYNWVSEVDDNQNNAWYGEVVIAGGGGGHTVDLVASSAVNMQPSGIASAEAFGTVAALGKITLTAQGIASAEAFGTTAALGKITMTAVGIATAEAFGTTALAAKVTMSPSSVVSAEAFGVVALASRITLSPVALSSAEAFGVGLVFQHITLQPTAVPSAEAHGLTVVAPYLTVTPVAIVSAESFGSPVIGAAGGPQTMVAIGIASAEAHGATSLSTRLVVIPSSVTTGEAVGSPVVATGLTLAPGGVASAEAFGVPTLSAILAVAPLGIASAEAHGLTSTGNVRWMLPTSIASAESFGTSVVSTRITLSPLGIASMEVVPSPSLASGLTMQPSGIASAQAFGTPVAMWKTTMTPVGVPSAEAFGMTVVGGQLTLLPTGIVSAQAMGIPSLSNAIVLAPLGISSLEAVGTPVFLPKITMSPSGIVSVEDFGPGPSLVPQSYMMPVGIGSLEAMGIPVLELLPARQTMMPSAIASLEAMGLPSAFIVAVSWVAAGDATADWSDSGDTSGDLSGDGTSAVWTSEESGATW
jgi:hypothetical protein